MKYIYVSRVDVGRCKDLTASHLQLRLDAYLEADNLSMGVLLFTDVHLEVKCETNYSCCMRVSMLEKNTVYTSSYFNCMVKSMIWCNVNVRFRTILIVHWARYKIDLNNYIWLIIRKKEEPFSHPVDTIVLSSVEAECSPTALEVSQLHGRTNTVVLDLKKIPKWRNFRNKWSVF